MKERNFVEFRKEGEYTISMDFSTSNLVLEYGPIFLKLLLAMLLGLALGLERTFAGKMAGMRTYALMSLGSCVLIIISDAIARPYVSLNFDPLRMAAGIVMGVGFLCGGLIVFRHEHLVGMTTAAGLWIAVAIGIAVGYGFYALAILTTLFTLFILSFLWKVEERFEKIGE